MIIKLFIIALLMGTGHLATILSLKIISQALANDILASIAEIDALILLLVSTISFGLQLGTTRALAISENWQERLKDTQQARLTLSLLLSVFSITGFIHSRNLLFLIGPIIALNPDYALYGRGRPIYGSFLAFIRTSSIAIALIMSSIFFKKFILETYVLSLSISYMATGILTTRHLNISYIVPPSFHALTRYITNFRLGIASIAGMFLGIGLINVASYFYNNNTIAVIYVALKLYFVFKAARRIIVQSFFKEINESKYALKVDFISIIVGATFVLCISMRHPNILAILIDNKFLEHTEVFTILGLSALISSFTTSSGTRLLLNHQDNAYTFNLLISSGSAIFISILFSHLLGDQPSSICYAILIGESILSILNVSSLQEKHFIKNRLKLGTPICAITSILIYTDHMQGEIIIPILIIILISIPLASYSKRELAS